MGTDIITAALVLASLVLLLWPGAIRRRGALFLAVGLLAVILLVELVPAFFGAVIGPGRFAGFVVWVLGVLLTLLRVGAFLLLVMAASGLNVGELLREVTGGMQTLFRTDPHGFPVSPTGSATPTTGAQSTGPGGSPPPKI